MLSRVWLSSVRRLFKTQQTQTARAFKALVNPVKAKPKRRVAKTGRAPAPVIPTWPVWAFPGPPGATKPPVALRPPPHTAVKPLNKKPVTARRVAMPLGRPADPAGLRIPVKGDWQRGLFKSAPQATKTGGAAALHYWLYRPSNPAPGPRPLVVLLHGCGQTALEFAQGTRMNELAERKGFAVLYPQQSLSREASRCWPWYTKPNQLGEGDAALLAELVQSVAREQRVDRRRIYVAGLSAGAAMAQILAFTEPRLFAAVGMHSGPVFGTADSAAGGFSVMQHGDALRFARVCAALPAVGAGPIELPALLIHGDADRVVRPVNLMQVARQFLLVNGLLHPGAAAAQPPLLREHPARTCGARPSHGWRTLSYLQDGKPRVVVCQIDGLEHAWSGGRAGLRYNSAAGPDASAMLWNFFAKHRRRALPALV